MDALQVIQEEMVGADHVVEMVVVGLRLEVGEHLVVGEGGGGLLLLPARDAVLLRNLDHAREVAREKIIVRVAPENRAVLVQQLL